MGSYIIIRVTNFMLTFVGEHSSHLALTQVEFNIFIHWVLSEKSGYST